MTLKQKVDQARKSAEPICADHPEITDVWYGFDNISIEEIQAWAKEVNREYDIVHRNGKDVLRLQCHLFSDNGIVIFAYSVLVKVIKPEIVKAEFIEA